ncbi:hypothetical protein ONE63_008044 [Megalurothrips usitatus]|uniref:Uncharacterized protein n=1 Tax=Megalurothrips usitatus TaxID=439358 RepID=A0AAV7XT38_9NEOP|nr:hypothetical protein ONE63_008044 [Megalurothrips usitatus]
MLVWLDNSPSFDPSDPNSKKDICNFIDKFISCSSKNINEDLKALQTHKHSHTCLKKSGTTECRFGIPYLPMTKTRILEPLKEDYDEDKIKKLKKIYKKIRARLEDEETIAMTFDQFLHSLNLSEDQYIKAIRSSLSKHQIFIKRDVQDIFISPFSIKMLDLMRSNQNIQFVLDAYGAACYIIDYINKSSRGMSQLMRTVLQQIREGNDSLRDCLKKISNTFYNNSELSIQEAAYNIL